MFGNALEEALFERGLSGGWGSHPSLATWGRAVLVAHYSRISPIHEVHCDHLEIVSSFQLHSETIEFAFCFILTSGSIVSFYYLSVTEWTSFLEKPLVARL